MLGHAYAHNDHYDHYSHYAISTVAWDTSVYVQRAGGTGPPDGMYEGPPTGLNLLQEGVAANWVTSVPSSGQRRRRRTTGMTSPPYKTAAADVRAYNLNPVEHLV